MPPRQSKGQKDTVGRVMHEYKHGKLDTGRGRKVKNPKQAIAIALREAGASKFESKQENRRNLRHTKARERTAATGKKAGSGTSRAELYEEAKRRNIAGRSRMDKSALQRALHP